MKLVVAGVFLILSTLMLSACSDDANIKAGRYGMMSDGTPQYAAVNFMNAVYNEQDMEKIIALSTERYGQLLLSYHTPRTIQRQVFNLRLDTLQAEVVSRGPLLGSDQKDDAEIEIKIEGIYNGDNVLELKTLELVKENGKWKVKGVKNSPY